MTREVVEEIRFDERCIIEDAEFTIQALKRSFRIIRDPGARVYTTAPVSLKAWLNQRRRWWYGNLQLWRMHRTWARRNVWMVLNYSGYVTSVLSLAMLFVLPFLLASYNNVPLALLRGLTYAVVPLAAFYICICPFFLRERKILVMLIPYPYLHHAEVLLVSTSTST